MLDPTKTYKLRDVSDIRLVNPIQIAPPDKYGREAGAPIVAMIEYLDGEEPSFWGLWDSEGKYNRRVYPGTSTNYDLVEVIDKPEWADWPIDTKVLVRKKGRQEYIKAHYAGEVNGKPTVWILGVTSWTAEYLEGAHPIRQSAFEIKLAEEQPE